MVTAKRLLSALMPCFLVFSSPAFGLEQTGCKFSTHAARVSDGFSTAAKALEHLASAARARARGDAAQDIEEAGQTGLAVARAAPRVIEIVLDLADRLQPDILTWQARKRLNGTVLESLHPVHDQTFETDTGPIRAYLKAHYRYHQLGTDRYGQLDKVHSHILAQAICLERHFFCCWSWHGISVRNTTVLWQEDSSTSYARMPIVWRASGERVFR